MEGKTQCDGVFAGSPCLAAKDIDRDQANGRGDPVTIFPEVGKSLVPFLGKVHFYPVQNLQKRFGWDEVLTDYSGQFLGQRLGRSSPVDSLDIVPPELQAGLPLGHRSCGFIHDIIHGPAKGVKGGHGLPLLARQTDKGKGQVRAAFSCNSFPGSSGRRCGIHCPRNACRPSRRKSNFETVGR